ncbi:aromatic aminobenezylarsenical efflux permease ArsG family transporter [Chloroflexota bacterium]
MEGLQNLARDLNIPVLSALILGLLTAISPCPMATNITAIAYVSHRMTDKRYAVMTSALYTLGRMFSYSIIGTMIIVIGFKVPRVAYFLEDLSGPILGPLLIVVGLLMLFANKLSFGRGRGILSSLSGKVADWGMFGGFLLGVIFALAFCPYSAVLYFGVLIPLALKTTGGIGLPAVFAIGTGFPVLIIGTMLSFGVSRVSAWFDAISRIERIVRIIASAVFICVGIYYVVIWVQT